MTSRARLLIADDPGRTVALDPRTPLSIGRDPANGLALAAGEGVSRHHALVRVSRTRPHQWLICDLGSANGTYLEGARLRDCRVLSDGDEIRLGQRGPVLLFRAGGAPARAQAAAVAPVAAAAGGPPRAGRLDFEGQSLALDQIRSAYVRSRRLYPHAFSWWLLLCLGGLLLLPFPLLFWPLQIGALAGWILLGSRQEHLLEVTLQDGMAHRHRFDSLPTALAHRNGIRHAIGQGRP
jgi:hypothetical protein